MLDSVYSNKSVHTYIQFLKIKQIFGQCMFKLFKKIKANANISKALRELGLIPDPFWNGAAFHILADQVVLGTINANEASICLAALVPRNQQPPRVESMFQYWLETNEINPTKIEVASTYILYRTNNGGFEGSFEEFIKFLGSDKFKRETAFFQKIKSEM